MRVLFLCVFIGAFPSFQSFSQTCCSGGIPLSNNLGLASAEKGTVLVGIHYDYNHLNTLNDGTVTLDDNSRLRITHSVLLNAGYSITNRLSVEGLFTWINQRRNITQFGNSTLSNTSGLGDAVLLLKYDFPNALGESSSIRLGVGAKIPLGSSTEVNDQGITYNADLQPGSNAWDIIYWASLSKNFTFRPTLTFSSRLVYRDTGTNDSYLGTTTYKFGNELQAFLNFSDQFLLFNAVTNPGVSVKYRNAQRDKTGGFDLPNTGGEWIFLIPGFGMNITPNLSFSTKFEIPLYSNVDGTQLTPTYRLTTGLLYRIPRKTKLNPINQSL